jgi:hypothetical protein
MIRISHITLPAGLHAIAQRGPDSELTVYVSDALPADRQRAAVRIALRASRRRDWRALLPVPAAAFLALGLGGLRRAAGVLRAHAVAWGTVSAAVAAAASAAVYIAVVPHGHRPVSTSQSPAASPPPATPRSSPRAHRQPVAMPPPATPRSSPRAHRQPAAAPPAGSPNAVATLAVQPTPAANGPSGAASPSTPATASPSPSPTGSSHCIVLLGIRVCLGVKG